jgi:hypothetical protein
MRVLVADKKAAQGESWDFCRCEDGELLTLMLFGEDFHECSRCFTGVDTAEATTAGVVAHLSEDEVVERLKHAGGIARAEGRGEAESLRMFETGDIEISQFLDVMEARPGEAYGVVRHSDGAILIGLR